MSDNKQEQSTEQERTTPINPDTWTTGTEPITDKQATELESLSKRSNEEIPSDLSGAGAHIQIEALKKQQAKNDTP